MSVFNISRGAQIILLCLNIQIQAMHFVRIFKKRGLFFYLSSIHCICPFICFPYIVYSCTVLLYNTVKCDIYHSKSIQCHWLSNLINWEWREYARGGLPRSAPLDISTEAGKCSPGEVTGLTCAVFVWQKAYWHFLDIKDSLCTAAGTIAADRFSIHSIATGALFAMERAGTFWVLRDWVSGAMQCTVWRGQVSMQRGNSECQIHWH